VLHKAQDDWECVCIKRASAASLLVNCMTDITPGFAELWMLLG
jgi:hypothetical protein